MSQVLLQANADVTVRDSHTQKTPYELAVQYKQEEVASLLKSAEGACAFF